MMEGNGTGSALVTNGSGYRSGRPKNIPYGSYEPGSGSAIRPLGYVSKTLVNAQPGTDVISKSSSLTTN
jgi:hypothetical protein